MVPVICTLKRFVNRMGAETTTGSADALMFELVLLLATSALLLAGFR
jgi:hypothetical protein